MNKDIKYEINTWRNLYLYEKHILFEYDNNYVYVRYGGSPLLTYNRADGSIKLFTDEIEFNVLKGIIESL